MQKPIIIRNEPTYSGLRTKLYGPLVVKERDLSNVPADQLPEDLEELASLEGVRKYPVRIKCALLAWNTLLEGLKEYEEKKVRSPI